MENKNLYFRKIKLSFCSLCLIILSVIIPGCKKDWLEAKVDKQQAVPQTVKDFQAMLDNVTSFNLNTTIGFNEISADGHYYSEGNFVLMASVNQFQNMYTWTINVPYNGGANNYAGRYLRILEANIVLDEAERSDDPDREGLAQVKAQALFHRGRIFFDLAQDFSGQYIPSSADSDLGIPLRLSTDVTVPTTRSSLRQTYDQIISDLVSAKEVLPDNPLFLTRASKPAVLGILAKVYLVMGDYVNSYKYANEYLEIKNELLDYNTIPASVPVIGVNKEVAFVSILANTSSLTSYYRIDQSLFDSYDINDLRRKVFFNVTPTGITFKGNYSSGLTHNFAGIATDEMYLIRAECFARLGNIGAALKDLNDLLRTRWAKYPNGATMYVDQTAIDETDALKKIFTERKKELILRHVRWSDLRRLNLDDRFKVRLTRTIGGIIYSLEPNSYKYTFPIPDNIISLSGIQQNSGY